MRLAIAMLMAGVALANQPPKVDPVADISIREMDRVALIVSARDPENRPLTYTFSVVQQPGGRDGALVINPRTANTRYLGVTQISSSTSSPSSDYNGQTGVVRCVVSDGTNEVEALFNVTINGYNRAPILVITGEFGSPTNRLEAPRGFSPSACSSYDPDGERFDFQWEIGGATGSGGYCPSSVVVGRGLDACNPSISIPELNRGAAVNQAVRLRVDQGMWRVTQSATVYLKPDSSPCADGGGGNLAPNVEAGNDICATLGQTVQLNGSASDPESDPLTYSWSVLSGTTTLSNPQSLRPTFTAPSFPTTLVLRLSVSDPTHAAVSDTVTVNVLSSCSTVPPPPPVIPPPVIITEPPTTTFPDSGVIRIKLKQIRALLSEIEEELR